MSKNSKPEYGLLEVTFSGNQDTCKDKKYILFEIIRKLLLYSCILNYSPFKELLCFL